MHARTRTHMHTHARTHTPEVSLAAATAATPFLIIATDGLWDVMTEQDAVEWALRYFYGWGLGVGI